MNSRLLLVPLLAVVVLAGCTTPSPGPGEAPFNDCSMPEDYAVDGCTGDGQWLADDLDLDSYLLEGALEGIRFAGIVCALNLDPSWIAYRDGNEGHGLSEALLFLAGDRNLDSGELEGLWSTEGGPGNFIEVRDGTWRRSGAGGMKEDGSIAVTATLYDHYTDPEAGTSKRPVSSTFTLTAIPTSPDCVKDTNLDALRQEREELGIGPWD